MKIYTRKGDQGSSTLASGVRVLKTDSRLAALGDLDELSAWLGLVVSSLSGKDYADDRSLLLRAQTACLAAGAWAAEASQAVLKKISDTVTAEDVQSLEGRIDEVTSELPKLTSFILPGGQRLAAEIQIARGVARRLERSWLSILNSLNNDSIWPLWREYWNRLSDYLFVLARLVNQRAGNPDEIWRGQS